MKRRIINIDRDKCNGCGACAKACHEGAIGMVDGRAMLLRDDYCDGLGDCLPTCPTGAITFVEREAAEYNEQAVLENKAKKAAMSEKSEKPRHIGCPGQQLRTMKRLNSADVENAPANSSALMNWPCQIKLVPPSASYFDGAKLLIAADCTAYSYANMHSEFMSGRVTLIGCPKLDSVDYSEKLTEILKNNNIKSVTVVRMEVPCCSGLENAVKNALRSSGRMIPWQVTVISTDGRILDR